MSWPNFNCCQKSIRPVQNLLFGFYTGVSFFTIHSYKGSTHTNAMLNAIPSRIEKLTSRSKKNAQMKIDEIYKGHAKALSNSRLAPNIYPTLK